MWADWLGGRIEDGGVLLHSYSRGESGLKGRKTGTNGPVDSCDVAGSNKFKG